MEWSLRMVQFVCSLLLPLAFIGLGQRFTKNPPKTIDPMCGYRTVMSMKNQDTWEFAQAYYGRTCYKIGWAALAVALLAQVWLMRWPAGSIEGGVRQGAFILLEAAAAVIANYVPVERALKKEFDKNGNRR